jgi:hypothetical protein
MCSSHRVDLVDHPLDGHHVDLVGHPLDGRQRARNADGIGLSTQVLGVDF